MSEHFTYERETTGQLETYEWDNLWWEHADDQEGKDRVLLIGDSISCGYRGPVNEELRGEIYADGLGTSKGLDNPVFFSLIEYVINQQKNCKLIQFNNGLHGWHLSVLEYQEWYRKFIRFFKEKYPDKQLVIALTTPTREQDNTAKLDERNGEVILRNKAVLEIAAAEEICVNDLYTPLIDHPEYYSQDGVHLIADGYRVLAKQCARVIREKLEK